METLEHVMRIEPLDLQARLAPCGKTIQDAVEFYVHFMREQQEIQSSQTLGKLMDEWLVDKKRRVEQQTLRAATYDTLY